MFARGFLAGSTFPALAVGGAILLGAGGGYAVTSGNREAAHLRQNVNNALATNAVQFADRAKFSFNGHDFQLHAGKVFKATRKSYKAYGHTSLSNDTKYDYDTSAEDGAASCFVVVAKGAQYQVAWIDQNNQFRLANAEINKGVWDCRFDTKSKGLGSTHYKAYEL